MIMGRYAMNIQITSDNHRKGSILVLVLILLVVLILAGLALLKVSEGRLIETVRIKSLESASAAAEAGYENAVFWMSQQPDMLESLESASQSVSLSFPQSSADYKITFANFIGARPVFKVEANGYHGIYQKTIQAYLVQAISGWELAKCQFHLPQLKPKRHILLLARLLTCQCTLTT